VGWCATCAGSLSQRLGIEEDPTAPLDHRVLLQERSAQRSHGFRGAHHGVRWATPQEIDDHHALAIRVNDFLTGVSGIGIRLVDFKMECGRLFENEMMRIIWRPKSRPIVPAVGHQVERKLDKDRFRRISVPLEAYTEWQKRLGF